MKKNDWRLLENGRDIPAVTYSDQPYIVKTDDGAWLCCVTTGSGHEGEPGQHVITTRSTDCGETWSEPIAVEPGCMLENSYAAMLKAPSGRIFIFYARNSDNIREYFTHDRKEVYKRVDCLGHFVFKYSDDHGRSWSDRHFDIPFRLFECDRNNVYGGKLCFFWNVGHPFHWQNRAYVSLIKVGEMGNGFYRQSEGALLCSPDLLTAADPATAGWETLPDGETGLRSLPGGHRISEEQNFLMLSDGSMYVTFRTVDGHPVEGYSRDGGHTWPALRYMQHPDGRKIKHPRAANFAWRCGNGRYLYWFHNHGGKFINRCPDIAYDDRNPVWLLPGIETDTPRGREISWGEPELLLYSDDPMIRMSYPDLVEEHGRYFFTETEKSRARLHEVPAEFLENMWAAAEGKDVAFKVTPLFSGGPGKVAHQPLPELVTRDYTMVQCPGVLTRNGFAIYAELSGRSGLLLGDRDEDGRGLELAVIDGRAVLTLDDGTGESRLISEPLNRARRLVINVDGGAGIVSFIADGKFLDGGDDRQFGWRRFNRLLIPRPNFTSFWTIGEAAAQLAVYPEIMQTAHAVSLTRPRP